MKISLLAILVFLSLSITSCDAPLLSNKKIFDKDFLFDNFDNFDTEIWDKTDNTYIGFSYIKKENVFTSNGNLIIRVPPNSSEGGGIFSTKYFRPGKFSIYVLNLWTNVALEFEARLHPLNTIGMIRYYFSEAKTSNIVECEITSPSTNVTTNLLTSPQSNYLLLTIQNHQNMIVMFFKDTEILKLNTPNRIEEIEIRINGYLKEYDTKPFSRDLLVEYFSYERN